MKVLGKTVSESFSSLYKDITAKLSAPIRFEEKPARGLGECNFIEDVYVIRLSTKLNRIEFEHNAAHELLHALQIEEKWPRTFRPSEVSEKSWQANLGSELGALVLDLDVEDKLKQFGFDKSYADNTRYGNAKKNLANVKVPPLGSPRGCVWAMRYAFLCLSQPKKRWERLKQLYWQRVPNIARKGEELISVIEENGWENQDKALRSMLAMRSSLDIPDAVVIIIDPRTGQRY